ncbi:MAG: GHKL domain-containing protein [Spirochaetes bacterium]|nr:GHKL domain-containing protein [Spirochaetota bacterium]
MKKKLSESSRNVFRTFIKFKNHGINIQNNFYKTKKVRAGFSNNTNRLNRTIPHSINNISQQIVSKQKIQQMCNEVSIQANILASANKELESFSYSISHDLRAPLRAIDGYTQILIEDYCQILDEEGERLCRIISSESIKMTKLIDNILTFSRLNRSPIQILPIDMKALAAAVFHELMAGNDPKKIEFKIETMPIASGDFSLIQQVWKNLISNAIKFSSKNAHPVIEIKSYKEGKDVIYYVRDNGVGFNMQFYDKLFTVFERLHSIKDFNGTGMGLAIVQRIIHRHAGKVWAESKINDGATFYFSLPLIEI